MFGMRSRILTGLGIFLGSLLVFYVFVYIPQIKYKKNLENQISQQTVRLMQLKKKFEELKKLREENQKLHKELSILQKKVKESEATFLHELGIRGKVYNIEYLQIIPLSPVEETYYSRIPINVHLLGKYHNLGMLISDMAREGGVGSFTVDEVWLRASSKDKYTIEANLTLSLYKYKKTPATSPGESKKSSSKASDSRIVKRRKKR